MLIARRGRRGRGRRRAVRCGCGAQAGSLRIVVPFSAGSGSDNSARVFAEALRQSTGRNVIVDNKAGGGTTIGSQEVSRSKPDGSTILFTTGGHTTNAVLMRNLPYDEFGRYVASEIERYRKFLPALGIQME
jgi:hypothetical protein